MANDAPLNDIPHGWQCDGDIFIEKGSFITITKYRGDPRRRLLRVDKPGADRVFHYYLQWLPLPLSMIGDPDG